MASSVNNQTELLGGCKKKNKRKKIKIKTLLDREKFSL